MQMWVLVEFVSVLESAVIFFLILYAYGRDASCCIFSVSSLASLYAGACCQLTIGRMRALIVGSVGFKFTYFHLCSGFMSHVVLFIVFLT